MIAGTGSSGTLLLNATYDSFGKRSAYPSTYDGDVYDGFGGEWGYRVTSVVGVGLLGHRFYDSLNARFVNRDPLGYLGGIDLYTYVRNGPTTHKDSEGLNIEMCWHNPPGDTPHAFICCTSPGGAPRNPEPPGVGCSTTPNPSPAPKPQCLGLEPSGSALWSPGTWDRPSSTATDTNCADQGATAAQQVCVCQLINSPGAPPIYGFFINNCADEAQSLLEQCGITPKPPALNTW